MTTELTAYVPRLLLHWEERFGATLHQPVNGTLVFADVSGFTALSERLERKGKIGAEEMADTISELFTTLLSEAAMWGGEMLKFGGDAMLLFFEGAHHQARAARAAWELQRRIRSAGRIATGYGRVVLRMSIGMSSGDIDLFVVGRRHRELLVLGPTTTEMVAMEAAADAGEVLLSKATASALEARVVGTEKDGGLLLRAAPKARQVDHGPVQLTDDGRRYLAPVVQSHLAGGGSEAEHRVATVSFIHFYGVDDLLAKAGPEAVATVLDDVVTNIQDILDRHRVAFLATDVAADGAKIMAAAGAPVATGSDEERSLRAAREIADLDGAVRVRVGVNAGRIFGGSVGPPFRRTYTAMGDPTNTAARLMGRSEGGQVVTMRHVMERSRVKFHSVALPPFLAKGKSEPLHPLAILDRSQGGGGEPEAPAGESRFIGRDDELAVLLGAATSARSGRGKAVCVVGEPGMGKTRLLDELEGRCRDLSPVRVLCQEYDIATPYAACAQLLHDLLQIEDPAGLQNAVERLTPHLRPLAPLIGFAARLELPATPETALLDETAGAQRLHDAVLELVTSAAATPQLWRLEDLHWCDPPSSAIFDAIIRQIHTLPVLAVASARPSSDIPGADTELIELGPLSSAAAKDLIEDRSPSPVLSYEVHALAERAGGNPLFLLSLLETVGSDSELPATIEGLLAARIDQLAHGDRNDLRRIAVLGVTPDSDVAAALIGRDVDVGRFSGLLSTEGDGSIRFSHALVRDAAYEGLPYRHRREAHRVAGEEYERTRGAASAELLSLHFSAAGVHDKAVSYSAAAAATAESRFSYITALTFYERALTHLRSASSAGTDPIALMQGYGDALRRCGRPSEAKAAYRRARAATRGGKEASARLMLHEGLCNEALGDYRGAVRWYHRALRELDASPSVLRSQCLLALGAVRILQGRLGEGDRVLLDALEMATTSAADREAAHALQLRHAVALSERRPDSRAIGERALAAARAAGDRRRAAAVLTNLGADAYYAAAWDDAERYYREAAELTTQMGAAVGAAVAEGNLGELYLELGRLDDAKKTLQRALSSFRKQGSPRAAFVQLTLARVAVAAGEVEEALSGLDEAEATLRQAGAHARVREVQVRRAEALDAFGLSGVAQALPPPEEVPAPLRELAERLRSRSQVAPE